MGQVARIGKFINAHTILIGIYEGETHLRIPRRRWEYKVKRALRILDKRFWTRFILHRTGFITEVL
jgi:hypothetical protein